MQAVFVAEPALLRQAPRGARHKTNESAQFSLNSRRLTPSKMLDSSPDFLLTLDLHHCYLQRTRRLFGRHARISRQDAARSSPASRLTPRLPPVVRALSTKPGGFLRSDDRVKAKAVQRGRIWLPQASRAEPIRNP